MRDFKRFYKISCIEQFKSVRPESICYIAKEPQELVYEDSLFFYIGADPTTGKHCLSSWEDRDANKKYRGQYAKRITHKVIRELHEQGQFIWVENPLNSLKFLSEE